MQTYRTEAGANAHTQTVVSASRGPITRTVVTLEGKRSVTTTQKNGGIQTVTTTYVTDPTTGEITSSIVTSSIAFDGGRGAGDHGEAGNGGCRLQATGREGGV